MADRMGMGALLVAMLDVDPSVDEDEFNRWYFEEHVSERLACPGFLSARRFKVWPGPTSVSGLPPAGAMLGRPRFLAIYELAGPDALETVEYRSLDSKASERTKRMVSAMRGVIRNLVRANRTYVSPRRAACLMQGYQLGPGLPEFGCPICNAL